MIGNKLRALITAGILAIVQNTGAAVDITWGGYLNAVGAVSDSATPYLASEIDDRGSYSDTTFGVNIGAELGEDLQLAAQLATHRGHKDIDLDWAFASYRLSEAVSVAVGQLKYPGNLVSEYLDVGYIYPWIRPPQELYGHVESSASMTLESFRGARLIYSVEKGPFEIDTQLYMGAAEEDTMNHDRMVGAVVTASTGVTRFLLGFNRSNMEMPGLPAAPMNGKDMTILSVGAMTEWRNFIAYAEVANSETEDVPLLDTTAWFTTLGYSFGKMLPHVTYTSLDQDTGIGQTTWTLGLRREITQSSALKLEWQRIKPDAITAAGAVAVPMLAGKAGLFESIPSESEIDMFSISVNILF